MFPSNTVTSLYIIFYLSGKENKKNIKEAKASVKGVGHCSVWGPWGHPSVLFRRNKELKTTFSPLFCSSSLTALAVLPQQTSPPIPLPSQIPYPLEDADSFPDSWPWAVQAHPLPVCNMCINQKCQKWSFHVIDVSQIFLFPFSILLWVYSLTSLWWPTAWKAAP